MSSAQRCAVCDEDIPNPSTFCRTCVEGARVPICDGCAARHAAPDRYPKFRGHATEHRHAVPPINLGAAGPGSTPAGGGSTARAGRRAVAPGGAGAGYCSVHRSEPIVFFCCEKECYAPLCSQCVAGHPRHCYRPVGDVAGPLRRFLVRRVFASSVWASMTTAVGQQQATAAGGADSTVEESIAHSLRVELEAAGARTGRSFDAPGAVAASSAADDRLVALVQGGTVADAEIASRLEALAAAREALDDQLAEALDDVNVAFDAAIAALEAREAQLVADVEVRP
jgi:hypothetical protein